MVCLKAAHEKLCKDHIYRARKQLNIVDQGVVYEGETKVQARPVLPLVG